MIRRLALAAASGALAFLSFAPYGYYPLAFVCLVPLLASISKAGPRRSFLFGFLAGVVGHAGGYPWVPVIVARFQSISILAASPFFLLFLAYHALPFALFSAGAEWIASRTLEIPPGARKWTARRGARSLPMSALRRAAPAALWVVLEWGFPQVVPWYLGSTLGPSEWLRQGADLAGVYGLSFLVALVNVLLARAWLGRGRPSTALAHVATALVLVGLAAGYGAVRLQAVAVPAAGDAGLTITAVQGDLRSGRGDIEAANAEAWGVYSELTERRAPRRADLVLWPETVLRVYLRDDEAYRRRLSALSARVRRNMLVGSLDVSPRGDGELNSIYLVPAADFGEVRDGAGQSDARGAFKPAQVYHKVALLPFGEYVPGANGLPFLRRWRTTGEFVPAARQELLTLPGARLRGSGARGEAARPAPIEIAPSICIEGIRPGWFNGPVRDGAALLINLTDDGWFAGSAAPWQHLELTRLRAVETRRWLVRASNSGISAFIDPTGRIVASLPFHVRGTLTREVKLGHNLSLYVCRGDWIVAACFALCVLAVLPGMGCRASGRIGQDPSPP